MHPALNVEAFDGCCDMTACQHLNRLFQLRVTLSQDLIQLHRAHPGFLKLRKWTASLYGFMLTYIAHE